jgi:PAT family beta-lactamase induction signal transducer AmpG
VTDRGVDISLRKKLLWVAVLYFAEGLPYGVVYDVLPVYFRQNGVSLQAIGFMSFLTLPWTIKVLWSPLVDRFALRRTWIAGCCAAMACVMLSIPLLDATEPSLLLWGALLALTLASATQDIAIDAYTIGLVSRGEEGTANGFRWSFYRVAWLLGGGATMYVVQPLGWTWVFILLALGFLALAFAAWATPPVPVVHQPPKEFARSFWRFLSRPGSIAVFLFVLTFRMDIMIIGPMIKPFWVDRGMTPQQIGTVSTMLGVAVTILGALLGGWVTSRVGMFHALWSLGFAQSLPSLAYAAVARWSLPIPYLYAASVAESFGSGLGTGVFLAFLMRICDKDQAATQYALLTGLFGLTRVFAGWSGALADSLGYASFFALTFALGLPAYAFLPWVRRWIGNGEGLGSEAHTTVPETGGASGFSASGGATAGSSPAAAGRRPASAPAR